MNHTKWAAILLAIVLGVAVLYSAQQSTPPKDEGQKVSDAAGIRILTIKLDMKNIEQQAMQVYQQQNQLNDLYEHDKKELEQAKRDAIQEAGRSPEDTDVDDHLKFVAKQKPAPKPEPKKEK